MRGSNVGGAGDGKAGQKQEKPAENRKAGRKQKSHPGWMAFLCDGQSLASLKSPFILI
jgi:hypothetical protein